MLTIGNDEARSSGSWPAGSWSARDAASSWPGGGCPGSGDPAGRRASRRLRPLTVAKIAQWVVAESDQIVRPLHDNPAHNAEYARDGCQLPVCAAAHI